MDFIYKLIAFSSSFFTRLFWYHPSNKTDVEKVLKEWDKKEDKDKKKP